MKGPQISWFIKEPDDTLAPYQEYFAGSYRPSETMTVQLQVWNNRWGQEQIEDATEAKLAIFFDTVEDSALLNLCSVKIGEGEFSPVEIECGKGYLDIGTLSGVANSGSASASESYAAITIQFGPIASNMKNSLKNMFVDVEYDSLGGGV